MGPQSSVQQLRLLSPPLLAASQDPQTGPVGVLFALSGSPPSVALSSPQEAMVQSTEAENCGPNGYLSERLWVRVGEQACSLQARKTAEPQQAAVSPSLATLPSAENRVGSVQKGWPQERAERPQGPRPAQVQGSSLNL